MEIKSKVLEFEITNLENEVGFAIFPLTRESFNSAREYRSFLKQIQAEKVANSEIWQRMKNWD